MFNKYKNIKYRYKKLDIIKQKPTIVSNLDSQPQQAPTAEFMENKKWLSIHSEPWETVEIKWATTSCQRIKEMSETKDKNSYHILNDWPLYINSRGYRLVILVFYFLIYFLNFIYILIAD